MVYRYKSDKGVGGEKTNTKAYPAISAGYWLIWKPPASHISPRKVTGATVLQVRQVRSICMVSWVRRMSGNFYGLGNSLGWPHFFWVMTRQFSCQQNLWRMEGQAGAVQQGTSCCHLLATVDPSNVHESHHPEEKTSLAWLCHWGQENPPRIFCCVILLNIKHPYEFKTVHLAALDIEPLLLSE